MVFHPSLEISALKPGGSLRESEGAIIKGTNAQHLERAGRSIFDESSSPT
jgi:hypothetical protein